MLLAAALLPLTLAGIGLALGSVVPAWPVREEAAWRRSAGSRSRCWRRSRWSRPRRSPPSSASTWPTCSPGLLFAAGLLLCAGVELGGDLLDPRARGGAAQRAWSAARASPRSMRCSHRSPASRTT
ncbi:MAG: hypothetical protein MZV64_35220 [Ignavibacteriales bacterium]|nr:hypothetical protein [Ignavibacteriales bacterium]